VAPCSITNPLRVRLSLVCGFTKTRFLQCDNHIHYKLHSMDAGRTGLTFVARTSIPGASSCRSGCSQGYQMDCYALCGLQSLPMMIISIGRQTPRFRTPLQPRQDNRGPDASITYTARHQSPVTFNQQTKTCDRPGMPTDMSSKPLCNSSETPRNRPFKLYFTPNAVWTEHIDR
jgi:hypothetical protein